MATRTRTGNRDISLSAAVALLIQNEARFISHLDEDRQRFARIERDLEEIKHVVRQHTEILKRHDQELRDLQEAIRNLPEAIRLKIGFKQ
jgi:hypothetical protein